MSNVSSRPNQAIDQVLADHNSIDTEGIFILDQSWSNLIIECTLKGLSVITPNMHMSSHLILQTIAGLNKSIVVTTKEIWAQIEQSFVEYSIRLQRISIVLI